MKVTLFPLFLSSVASKSLLRQRKLTVDQVVGLELIDASTNQKVADLSDNAVIDLGALGMTAPNFNINAIVSSVSGADRIDSVKFDYFGSQFRSEGVAPYAFCGDSGGNFYTCTELGLGSHTVAATAHSNGAPGTAFSVNFNIIVSTPNTSPTSQAPASSAPVAAPTSQAPISQAPVAPVAQPTAPRPQPTTSQPTSEPTVELVFDETNAPTPVPTAGSNVPSVGIVSLRLIHAPSGVVVAELHDGDAIDVSAFTPEFNIQAYNVGNVVKKVAFSNGRTEGVAPYAYCGDNGGSYYACDDLGLGTFAVSATPTSVDNQEMTTLSATFSLTQGPTPNPTLPPPPSPSPTATPTVSMAPTGNFNPSGAWIEVDADADITARHEACFVMAGRKAVLIGGRGGRGVDVYDPVTRTWQKGADPPKSEIHHMQCVAVDDKVYIVAAWTGWYPRETNAEHVYVYSHATDTWEEKTALPESRRRGGAAAILVGRNIYVSHGNRGGHEQDGANAATSLGWLDYYNVDTDTWTTGLPDAPNPRDHTGGALVNGHLICVSGGRNGGIEDWPEVAETDCFDLNTQTWSVEADIPQVRGGSSYGQTCDGQLIIAGGEGGGKAWKNVDVFDGTSWTTIAPLNLQRHGSGLAVDCQCGQIHIASGATGQGGGPETTSVETFFFGGVDQACNV